MISKAKLKELAAYRMAKTCQEERLFVVEGPKMCLEALEAGLPVRALCATAPWLQSHQPLLNGIEAYEVSDAELERLSSQKSPNQVWMLLSRDFSPLCEPGEHALTLVLDRLQDPGNLGTIIRTADWFGLRRIVCSPDTVSCFNPKVVQATMGGIFRTTVEYRPLQPFLEQVRSEGRQVYGALLDGESLYSMPLQPTDALLVIGNESRGISPDIQPLITRRILIPNLGGTCESLNASIATAILISHFQTP